MVRKQKGRVRSPTPSDSNGDSEVALEAPTEIDPYEVLGITTTANETEIKSAYRKAALRSHPDKASPDQKQEAHKKFQEVAFAYAVLGDESRRKRYDATGNTAETLDEDDFDWVDFFRSQRAEVLSASRIEEFRKEYQGSQEESADVLRTYTEHEGDMDAVYECVMCSNVLEDDERFRTIIDEAIHAGTVQSFKRYAKEGKVEKERRRRKAKAEEVEAANLAEELGVKDQLTQKKGNTIGDEDNLASLKAIIQSRQKERATSFLDNLEFKYGGGSKGSSTKRKIDEPPEEAFRNNAKKSKGRSR